eukprot:5983864-Amphidinium_carterae.1
MKSPRPGGFEVRSGNISQGVSATPRLTFYGDTLTEVVCPWTWGHKAFAKHLLCNMRTCKWGLTRTQEQVERILDELHGGRLGDESPCVTGIGAAAFVNVVLGFRPTPSALVS